MQSQPQQQSRCQELMNKMPLVVLLTIIICISVFVYCNLAKSEQVLPYLTLSVAQIQQSPWDIYRIVSSAFTHLSLLHIGMNMLSFYSLGSSLERLHGSLVFMWLLSIYVVLIGSTLLLINVILSYIWKESFWYQGVAGYSGVIFALAVDETASSPHPYRSIFGLFSVPTKLYPWVLLIALQFLLPNVSFVGHLSGILVGGLHVAGCLRFLLPKYESCRKLEDKPWFRPIRTLSSYKLTPSTDPSLLHTGSFFGHTWQAIKNILRPLTDCLRITGRNRAQNAHPSDVEYPRSSYSTTSNGSASASGGSRGLRVDERGNIQRDSPTLSSPHMDRSKRTTGAPTVAMQASATASASASSSSYSDRGGEGIDAKVGGKTGLSKGAAKKIVSTDGKVHPNVLFSDEAAPSEEDADSYDEEVTARMGLLSNTEQYLDDATIGDDLLYMEQSSLGGHESHSLEHVSVTVSPSGLSSIEAMAEREKRLAAIEKRLALKK